MESRIIPSSFDPDDPNLQALVRPAIWRWASCERVLRDAGSRGVLTRLPLYWQAGLPLHDACRAVGIPLFTNEPENIPVGAMSLKLGGIDTVVTEARDAGTFAEYLVKRALPYPKLGLLIHRTDDVWEVPQVVLDTWNTVSQEVHESPGVPVLDQCATLSYTKKPQFHLSDEHHTLPHSLKKTGECSCGKEVFEQLL